jgi:primosomal protein N' (replication factor Y)
MSFAQVIVEVAPAHLDRPFDYRIPEGMTVAVGQRVRVVFAGRRRVGWVVATSETTAAEDAKIREVAAVDGDLAWFDDEDLALYRWVARRYAGTVADVLRHALPPRVAAVEREGAPDLAPWEPGATSMAWDGYDSDRLLADVAEPGGADAYWVRPLPHDRAGDLVGDLVRRCLRTGRTALVLGADPGSDAPEQALGVAGRHGVDLRGESQRQRYRAFLRCRDGRARVAVGERSAIFAPLRDLGLIVVDDEANPAYKERRSPRHHAREVALARARMAGATCVLLGDVPSANLVGLLRDRHVTAVGVTRALERDRAPRVDVVDLSDPKPTARRARFADAAAATMRQTVDGGGAAVVLASRGGQGAALVCRGCGDRLACPVCTGSVSVARGDDSWRCPACAWAGDPFACPRCGDERFAPLAAGAGRLAAELRRSHSTADVVRMEGFDAPGPARRPAIGVMTRGSVVTRPAWLAQGRADVVVLPDADAMVRRPGYAAAEDALRLWFAVARWTDHVVLQTRDPSHHAIQALVRWDPAGFWDREVERRTELRLPPVATLIQLRCPDGEAGAQVAGELRAALPRGDEVLGPDLAGAVLVKSSARSVTLAALLPLRKDWAKHDRKVRIDVDPLL